MKRLLIPLLILASMVLIAGVFSAFAAGSCTQTPASYQAGYVMVTLACTGDAANGSIPNTAIATATMNILKGTHYLYTVAAYPTSGGTAPDAADVFILDANGEDLLGSVDGGTTANKGANLIHATLKKTTLPYSGYLGMHYFPAVMNTLTLKVANQATVSANYTVELVFGR
jgi:hypothetical protein